MDGKRAESNPDYGPSSANSGSGLDSNMNPGMAPMDPNNPQAIGQVAGNTGSTSAHPHFESMPFGQPGVRSFIAHALSAHEGEVLYVVRMDMKSGNAEWWDPVTGI